MDGPPVREAIRVLCVSIDDQTRAALERALTGCDIAVAHTAGDAVRSINAAPFDLYVSEYWIPEWTGVSLCREVRRHDRHVPFIFCAATPRPEHRTRAERAGATSWHEKPIDPQSFIEELRGIMETSAERNRGARPRAVAAVRQELVRRDIERGDLSAILPALATLERVSKKKAWTAFADAKGTLCAFERHWPGIWAAALGAIDYLASPAAISE